MKVTIINGNARRGNTWHCMDLFIKALSRITQVDAKSFTLPHDMPHHCAGCFSCFLNGEQTCPHADSIQPIAEALLNADLIILTSPVYALDVSGQLKSLLDHLCYMWMSHRPNPLMFNKVGLTIATTAGAGLGHATKTIRNSLMFWGIKRTFSYKKAVSAIKWSDLTQKKRRRIERDLSTLAKRVAAAVKKIDRLPPPLVRRIFFWLMASMMRKNTWVPRDRKHWEEHGWI